MIGKTLAHYRITGKIGAGGMGEVYRAADSKLGRDVALKMLPPGFADDPERLARFRREAVVLAQLNHPNIGAIYGFEETGDTRALVLELVEGPTLHDVIRNGPVPVAEALPIARQIAEAVEAAHERGVMHRDLKPANVKVTEDGRVKVLDFGLARALEGDAPAGSSMDSPTMSPTLSPTLQSPVTGALTGANVILGTAAYMSPEQARGKAVDKRCDIWSFGVILFEMLTGRSLFAGETVSDTLAGVLKTEPDWESLPSDVPPRIVRLLHRCLERDPRKRLRDIGDARLLITEVMEGRHEEGAPLVAAGPAATVKRPRPWVLAVALLVTLASGATIGWLLRPAPPEPEVRRFLVPVPDGRLRDLSLSPDGRHLAYTLDDELWVRAMDRIEPRRIAGSEGAREPAWSPDGSMMAYRAENKLWKVGLAEGKPTVVCDLEDGDYLQWQDDGTIVCGNDRKLQRVAARGGEIETVLELPSDEVEDLHGIASLPGGKGWAAIVHDVKDKIAIEVIRATGERTRILELPSDDVNLWDLVYCDPGYLIYTRVRSNTGIWALPFSIGRLEATGDPFLVVPDGGWGTVTRDGATLAAVPQGPASSTQLVWVGLDGSLEDPVGQPQESILDPALSPDGTRVVVRAIESNETDLWIHDVERSTKTRLTFADGIEASPQWTPDGRTIYFSHPAYRRATSIWRVPADGSGEPEELFPGGFPSLSADGKWLAFERFGRNDKLDVWKWQVDGGGDPEPLVATEAWEDNASLSPDGKWLAYESDESGRREVYLKAFPSGGGKWQVSVDGGRWAEWSREGDQLFFVNGNTLYRVGVETNGGLRLSSPETRIDGDELDLASQGRYSVAPGGKRILMVREMKPKGEDAKDEIHGLLVVENWLSELR